MITLVIRLQKALNVLTESLSIRSRLISIFDILNDWVMVPIAMFDINHLTTTLLMVHVI